MEQGASSVMNQFEKLLSYDQPELQLATSAGAMPTNSKMAKGMNNYMMMQSQKPQMGGGYQANLQRQSVKMNAASGAIPSVSGGMPDVIPDYMDELGKIRDKAMG